MYDTAATLGAKQQAYGNAAIASSQVPPDGIASVISRVCNLSAEVRSMAASVRQNIAPSGDLQKQSQTPQRVGLLGALQDVEDTLRLTAQDLSFLGEHINS